ncbi:MAG TPA: hypothetical protein VK469_07675 [Candidatus Kapabacteria bacterium]|nr:hypothetical protein [Candidatus Kapabacteria bacterium]
MFKSILIFCIVTLMLGAFTVPNLLTAQDTNTTSGLDDMGDNQNYFMGGLTFIVGFILLWFLFHKLIYPFLLKYYHPEYCKKLFWSLIMLYGLAWITIGAYVIFDFGFRIHAMKWIFLFIGVIWIIWFLVIILRKDASYYQA